MSEEKPIEASPIATPLDSAEPQSDYLFTVASKKVSWAAGKLIAGKIAGVVMAPQICDSANAFGDSLKPYGLYFHFDLGLIQKSLPILIFMGLVAGHDYAKLRFKSKWL